MRKQVPSECRVCEGAGRTPAFEEDGVHYEECECWHCGGSGVRYEYEGALSRVEEEECFRWFDDSKDDICAAASASFGPEQMACVYCGHASSGNKTIEGTGIEPSGEVCGECICWRCEKGIYTRMQWTRSSRKVLPRQFLMDIAHLEVALGQLMRFSKEI
jgi:hypothetical protein